MPIVAMESEQALEQWQAELRDDWRGSLSENSRRDENGRDDGESDSEDK